MAPLPSSDTDSDFEESRPRYAHLNKRARFVVNKVLQANYESTAARKYAHRRLLMIEDDPDGSDWHTSEGSEAEDVAAIAQEALMTYAEVKDVQRHDHVRFHYFHETALSILTTSVQLMSRAATTMDGTVKRSVFYNYHGAAVTGSGCDPYLVVTPSLLAFFRETHRMCRRLDRRARHEAEGRTPRPVADVPADPPVSERALRIASEALYDQREAMTDGEYVVAMNAIQRAFQPA